MKNELNILLIEDDQNDAEIIQHTLHKGGLRFRLNRVDTETDFLAALQSGNTDLILSDHGLPSFSGFEALATAQKQCPEVPFIFVTGLMGEEKAVETLARGATDYVLKTRLSKLPAVVQRAVREAEERTWLRRQEQALRESQAHFRVLVEGVKEYAIALLDIEGRVASWNVGAEWIFGYQASEIVGQYFSGLYPEAAVMSGAPHRALRLTVADGRFEEEARLLRKGGQEFWANVVITALRDARGALRGLSLITRDITERKRAEAERERLIAELRSALIEAKTLSGLLPMCASCKKIRNYHGQWFPLEVYLREHSEAILTHEFCHDCAQHITPTSPANQPGA